MKILYYLDTLGRGGAEMQALDICRNAGDYGIELTIVSCGGVLEGDFRSTGVHFEKLVRHLPIDPLLALRLRKIIIERRIQIVHGYQPVDGVHLLLATLGLSGVRRVLSFQGFIQDRRNRLAAKLLTSRMDSNIVVSRGFREYLSQTDGLDTSRRFTVIYNGADPQRLVSSGKSIRKELGIAKNMLLIGMIANFYRDPRKDQMTLCRALPAVFDEIGNVHCLFAGGVEDGAERKLSDCIEFCDRRGIGDRVHFVGSRSDIADIFVDLDVFVLSSLYEGLPVVVSEAMLAGVPVVVSDIGPLIEASDNGRVAKVFPVGDHQALSRELISLLKDRQRRDELAAAARNFAERNVSIQSHLTALTDLYNGLLSK